MNTAPYESSKTNLLSGIYTMEFDPVAFGGRLKVELARRDWNVKALQEKLRAKTGKIPGTSYGSLWSYVNGQAPIEPRREAIEALAELLNILPHFLMTGDGPRTAVEAAAAADSVGAEGDEETQKAALLFHAMRSAEEQLGTLKYHPFHGRDQILEGLTISFLESGGRDVLSCTPEQVEDAMLTLAWLIQFPADALGAVDFYNRPGGSEEYFMAAATVIRIAISGADSGFPLNAIDRAKKMREVWR